MGKRLRSEDVAPFRVVVGDVATQHRCAETACAVFDEACGSARAGDDVATLEAWNGERWEAIFAGAAP